MGRGKRGKEEGREEKGRRREGGREGEGAREKREIVPLSHFD